jgi:integrase/recombinase XerD
MLLKEPTKAKDNDPKQLSPIALRLNQDLQLNGKGERTQESYIRMLRKFIEFLKRDPDSATEDDLRNYLLFLKNQRQWSNSTIDVAYCSLKFFFSKTCPRDWPTVKKLKVQPELKLPTVLTVD